MKLIKSSTIVLILSNILCIGALAQEGVESESFQRIKQELWAFGPSAQPLKNSAQKEDTPKAKQLHEAKQDFIPEELSRALMKYSVEL